MTMTIGLSGYDFKNADVATLAVIALSVGAETLELWPHNLRDLSVSQIQHITASTGVEIACINAAADYRVHGPLQPDTLRAHFTDCIRLAAELDAQFMNIYIAPNDALDQSVATIAVLEPVLSESEAAGVRVLVENHFDNRNEDPREKALARTPEGVRNLWEASGRRLACTFDPANYLIAGIEPYPLAYELVCDVLEYVHIKDVTRLLDPEAIRLVDAHRGPYSLAVVGQGAINYSGLLRALTLNGYEGVLMVEPHVAEEKATLLAKDSIAYLRGELDRPGTDRQESSVGDGQDRGFGIREDGE